MLCCVNHEKPVRQKQPSTTPVLSSFKVKPPERKECQ
ncbi:hypothetical protein TNIN_1081, partial [Trichonephila inaurata madagascariensis]